jgi:hypothetical protein
MKGLNQILPLDFEDRLEVIEANSKCLKAYEDAVVAS